MSYNGWYNLNTWNVALWLNNDFGFYTTAMSLVQDVVSTYYMVETRRTKLSVALHDFVASKLDETGVFGDLTAKNKEELYWIRLSVDWVSIADSFLETVED